MIKFISHRGNLNGPSPDENKPDYIESAIEKGYTVEVDLRMVGSDYYLGHDYPQYQVAESWLNRYTERLLLHVKDIHALKRVNPKWHIFCHASDKFTITSWGRIWLHDLSLVPNKDTIVPLMTRELVVSYPRYELYAICSDYEVNEHGNLKHNG